MLTRLLGEKCVLHDTIMCDASMCGDGEGCHDDSPTLLYIGVCLDSSVLFPIFAKIPSNIAAPMAAPRAR